MNLKVYLADDHTLFLKTVAKTVANFENVGTVKYATRGPALLKLIKEDAPDVVLLDYEMPRWNGLQTADRILQLDLDVKIILLSMHDSPELIATALDQGIHAFLLKNVEPEELELAINKVYENDFYRNKITNRALRKRNRVSEKNPQYANISTREREILLMICEELTMRQIADSLCLSDKTIQNHRQNMIKKLEVKNTAGLVKRAIEFGIYIV